MGLFKKRKFSLTAKNCVFGKDESVVVVELVRGEVPSV